MKPTSMPDATEPIETPTIRRCQRHQTLIQPRAIPTPPLTTPHHTPPQHPEFRRTIERTSSCSGSRDVTATRARSAAGSGGAAAAAGCAGSTSPTSGASVSTSACATAVTPKGALRRARAEPPYSPALNSGRASSLRRCDQMDCARTRSVELAHLKKSERLVSHASVVFTSNVRAALQQRQVPSRPDVVYTWLRSHSGLGTHQCLPPNDATTRSITCRLTFRMLLSRLGREGK